MNYSSIFDDPEQPHEGSPWGNPNPAQQQSPQPQDQQRQQQEQQDQDQDQDQDQTQHRKQHFGDIVPDALEPPSRTSDPFPSSPVQHHTHTPHPARHSAPNPMRYKLQAKITALERIGKKDLILRFDVQTSIPKFRTSQFRDIQRTHSEFIKLADHLIPSNPEALVPAVPPPLSAAGAGTEEDEFRIKASMQRWLNYVCSNDVLKQDDEMVLFVESDFGYSPLRRMEPPATGMRRKMLKQLAPPPDDTPELQDARPMVKGFYLGSMDAGQKLDRVVKARRALALAESDLGVKIGQLHAQETHPGLASAYRKLGRIIQAVGDNRAAQGTGEATTLQDPFNYHSSDAFIVKETLTNRQILLREFNEAQQSESSKRAAAERLRTSTSVRSDKVDAAVAALKESKEQLDVKSQKTSRVTGNLLQEKRRWFSRTSNDLVFSIREYTLRQIEAERRTLATLESVRPDVRAIDSSGGLSRLGREAHPSVRRANLASSQGPRGDAWSGLPRSTDSLGRSMSAAHLPGVRADEDKSSARSSAGSKALGRHATSIAGDEEDSRIDAKNAVNRLATSTF